MSGPLVLVSHALCPYVQRAAIVLAEKGLPFERRDIDLANKPAWFLAVSPLGKTPVLLVDDAPIFEPAVVCEYLEDTALPRLHPNDAVQRAQHRAWMEFGSALLYEIGAFYNASDEADLPGQEAALAVATHRLAVLLGRSPSEFEAPASPAIGPHAVALRMPEPAQWVAQRPDLRSAEAQLRAQARDVAAVRSEFMPRLSVAGVLGFVAGSISGLGAAGSASWFVAPSLSVPVFDIGRIDARRLGTPASRPCRDGKVEKWACSARQRRQHLDEPVGSLRVPR